MGAWVYLGANPWLLRAQPVSDTSRECEIEHVQNKGLAYPPTLALHGHVGHGHIASHELTTMPTRLMSDPVDWALLQTNCVSLAFHAATMRNSLPRIRYRRQWPEGVSSPFPTLTRRPTERAR